jgi:hypothetical protein
LKLTNRLLNIGLKKYVGEKDFQVGNLVLKWDKPHEDKGKHSKFQQLWLGPFIIKEKIGLGTYHLQNLEGDIDLLPINGQVLKHYISYPLRQIFPCT